MTSDLSDRTTVVVGASRAWGAGSLGRSPTLRLELGSFGPDPVGGTRAGFTAIGRLQRSDFGVDFNPFAEAAGVVVGDKVDIHLEIEAVLNT